jgi:hypothetical protein
MQVDQLQKKQQPTIASGDANAKDAIPRASRQPPGLGSPFRRTRPADDSYPTFRFHRRFVLPQARKGLISAVMPSSFFSRFLALVIPRSVLSDGLRYRNSFTTGPFSRMAG